MAREDGEAEDPLCVSQATAPEQQLVGVHRYALTGGQYEVTVELVEEFVGFLALHLHTDQLLEQLLISQLARI